jgi:hypothetical protein
MGDWVQLTDGVPRAFIVNIENNLVTIVRRNGNKVCVRASRKHMSSDITFGGKKGHPQSIIGQGPAYRRRGLRVSRSHLQPAEMRMSGTPIECRQFAVRCAELAV